MESAAQTSAGSVSSGHPSGLLLAAALSGAAALIHETLWMRAFSALLGSTVEATAVTAAVFLVGLALGAWIGGARRPGFGVRRAYVVLELSIAVIGGGAGLLLFRLRDALAPGLGIAIVLLPTLLMGATFPWLLAVLREHGGARTLIPRVYALSTLGAALGTILCGFFTLRLYGFHASLAVAVICNLASAAVVLRAPIGTAATDAAPRRIALGGVPPEWLLLGVSAWSGVAVLAFEVVWSRLASFILGTRTFALTTLLAWVLLLLASGAGQARRLLVRRGDDVNRLLGRVLLLAPCMLTVSTALARAWIAHQGVLDEWILRRGAAGLALRALAVGAMMAPALLVLGILFPLTLAASRDADERVARAAGRFQLWNTLGAVTGALVTGFVVMPAVGVYACASLIAIGAALIALAWPRSGPATRLVALVLLAGVMAWRPPPLCVVRDGDALLFRKEDRYGVFQVMRQNDGLLRAISNNTELVYLLGAPITAYVQQMQGHLGVLANPRARTALVLGSGYGITAGALGSYPTIDRVDAVEILPAMLEAAPLFAPHNLGYERNPRVHRVQDDGRHFLARSDEAYDVISINVSDPHLPGSASLFTRDFYEIVRRHLRPSGVAVVHAFGSDKAVVLSTLHAVFGNLRVYRAYLDGGFNVVASVAPLEIDDAAIRAVTAPPAVQAALERIGFAAPVDAAQIWSRGVVLTQGFDPALIATDDRPLIEFSTRGGAALLFHSNE